MKKWAFLGVKPHMGGTWTVFENLRGGLTRHNIELRWVVAGKRHAHVLQDSQWSEQCKYGEIVAVYCDDDFEIVLALKDHLLANYNGALVNVLCDPLCTNLMRYMPSFFPRVMLVHNITIGTYVAANSIRDYVHATVGVSKRIQQDLINKYDFDKIHTYYIPNAISVERFSAPIRSKTDKLKILVLSRIENQSKGSFRIPTILRRLSKLQVPYECTLAGDGPDLEEMKKRCSGLRVQFTGRVPTERVPDVMASHDVYLFPSNYEGFGLSLVEAMAAGCVPISSILRGVTDQIVENTVSGFLVRPRDIEGFASNLKTMFDDPTRLAEMSNAARLRAIELFSVDSVAIKWHALIYDAQSKNNRLPGTIINYENWTYPSGLRPGLRSLLPEPLKYIMRLIYQYFSEK